METSCCRKQLLVDPNISHLKPSRLYYDDNLVIHLASNQAFHECTKHIQRNCHVVIENSKVGSSKLHVSTNQQLANSFTKALEHLQAEFLLCKLGVLNFHFNLMGSFEDQTYKQNSPTKFVKEDQISMESSPTTSTSPCNQQNQAYKETNGSINQSRFHKSRDFVCKKHLKITKNSIDQFPTINTRIIVL